VLPERYEESEAPHADAAQGLFALMFLMVWAVDSFWFHWTTHLSRQVPGVVRVTLFLVLALVGGYLSWRAHEQIFGVARDEPELVDYGVFRLSRHPMYLGIMMIYLGLSLSSVSLAALAVLAAVFLFYDYLASYEEARLVECFGNRYLDYMDKVRRWL
jgi:protein-S-isoprenylcysteine O-methyltransferase Ste14